MCVHIYKCTEPGTITMVSFLMIIDQGCVLIFFLKMGIIATYSVCCKRISTKSLEYCLYTVRAHMLFTFQNRFHVYTSLSSNNRNTV